MRACWLWFLAGIIPAVAGPAALTAPGEAVWNQHCSQCHDTIDARIPPRNIIAAKTRQAVLFALSKGAMRPQAAALSAEQIRDVAAYITHKEPGRGGDIDLDIDVRANLCTQPAPPMKLGAADWNGYGANTTNSRAAMQAGLTAADVPRLKLKWAFAYPAQPGMQPTAAGGRLFVASRSGHLWSLDPQTGCTYWVVELGAMVRGGVMVGALPRGTGAKYAAYFATEDSYMRAVDAETGRELWNTRLHEHPLAHITSAATLYKGRIYQGIASQEEVADRDPKYPCCTISGTVVAVDAVTGRILWKNTTIGQPAQQIGVNSAGTPVYGPAGAGVWTAPVTDPKRHAVYVGTGNSNTPVSTASANAVIAFDIRTGKRLWVTQVVADDNRCPRGWQGQTCVSREFDLTANLLLHTLPNGKRVVLASSKSGEAYGLDPDANGKLLWKRQLHQASGFSGRWGLALDGTSLFVGSNVLISGRFAPADAVPGGIVAADPATGDVRWSTPAPPAKCSWSTPELLQRPSDCNGSQQAGLAAVPGAVFAGSADGHVRAYDARTGAVFWDFDTGGTWNGVNGATALGGSLSYGAIAVAYGMLFVDSGAPGYHEGNALLAFSVEGH